MTTLHYNKKLVEKTTLKHYWTCVACLRIESNDDITLAQKLVEKTTLKHYWTCVACLRIESNDDITLHYIIQKISRKKQ